MTNHKKKKTVAGVRRLFAFVVVVKVDAVVDGEREALAVDLEPVDWVVLRPGTIPHG